MIQVNDKGMQQKRHKQKEKLKSSEDMAPQSRRVLTWSLRYPGMGMSEGLATTLSFSSHTSLSVHVPQRIISQEFGEF